MNVTELSLYKKYRERPPSLVGLGVNRVRRAYGNGYNGRKCHYERFGAAHQAYMAGKHNRREFERSVLS